MSEGPEFLFMTEIVRNAQRNGRISQRDSKRRGVESFSKR
jgi:hypothetical protein